MANCRIFFGTIFLHFLIILGYYGDIDTECQAFHVCTADGQGGLSKYSFLCPNGTIFNQGRMIIMIMSNNLVSSDFQWEIEFQNSSFWVLPLKKKLKSQFDNIAKIIDWKIMKDSFKKFGSHHLLFIDIWFVDLWLW